jgi:hypothetical protein
LPAQRIDSQENNEFLNKEIIKGIHYGLIIEGTALIHIAKDKHFTGLLLEIV